jgi:hypothetical protein
VKSSVSENNVLATPRTLWRESTTSDPVSEDNILVTSGMNLWQENLDSTKETSESQFVRQWKALENEIQAAELEFNVVCEVQYLIQGMSS